MLTRAVPLEKYPSTAFEILFVEKTLVERPIPPSPVQGVKSFPTHLHPLQAIHYLKLAIARHVVLHSRHWATCSPRLLTVD